MQRQKYALLVGGVRKTSAFNHDSLVSVEILELIVDALSLVARRSWRCRADLDLKT